MDPRWLRLPRLRRYLVALACSAVLTALLIIAQATALARLVSAAVTGRLDRPALLFALAVFLARALQHWLFGLVAAGTAAGVKADLRAELLAAAARQGPDWLAGRRAGTLATLVGRGVDALDGYLVGYLPQLFLSVTVPVAVLIRIALADPTSALVVAITLPLIPIFAILVGWQTKARTDRQWRLLAGLGGHFLDMLAGIATLRSFGRAGAQVAVVRGMAEKYRAATMATLRIAFLSALVLELISSISVALVAVPIGLRLLDGALALPAALLVLLLAPEAYAPLRTAGARFHASQEGLAAATEIFAILDAPAVLPGGPVPAAVVPGVAVTGAGRRGARVPDPAEAEIVFAGVSVRGLREVSFTLRPGERVALIGPNGAGKSTILGVLLGFVPVDAGRVLVGGVDLSTVDIDAWRARLAWVPQRPHLFASTVAANIALGAPDTARPDIERAARAAHAHDFITDLPDGYDTRLGEGGLGLSTGQRQRLALARAFLRTAGPHAPLPALAVAAVPLAGSPLPTSSHPGDSHPVSSHPRGSRPGDSRPGGSFPAGPVPGGDQPDGSDRAGGVAGGAGLVLLDEPTAGLDGASEAAVLDASAELLTGRGGLVVAHRPALLASVDRVLRVRAGTVVEAVAG